MIAFKNTEGAQYLNVFNQTNTMMNSPSKSLTNEEIVALLQGKDIQGIHALYDQYGSYLLGLISEIVKVEYFSEIVLQNTFLKIWNNIDSFSTKKGRFFTWVINIARNSAIDMMRSKNYKQSMRLINLDNVAQKASPIGFDINVENMDIKDIVSKLDTKYRELIEMVYFKGYTHMEVAEELSIPLGTVKSRIRKAFKDLRDILS